MSSVQPYQPLLLAARTTRALARLGGETTVAVAVTQARAEVEAAKIDAVAAVGTKALQDVALLSQIEQSLATAVPHASGRLASVADLTAIAIADQVAQAARRLGR